MTTIYIQVIYVQHLVSRFTRFTLDDAAIRARALERVTQEIQAVSAFRKIDTSGDGVLSLDELRAAAQLKGLSEEDSEQLVELFEALDGNTRTHC